MATRMPKRSRTDTDHALNSLQLALERQHGGPLPYELRLVVTRPLTRGPRDHRLEIVAPGDTEAAEGETGTVLRTRDLGHGSGTAWRVLSHMTWLVNTVTDGPGLVEEVQSDALAADEQAEFERGQFDSAPDSAAE